MNPLTNFKIIIAGGSIAGCASAILLSRLGCNVQVLERSLQPHRGRGAGVVLPESFIKQCIELDLFDKDIPRLPFESRSFNIKDPGAFNKNKAIWRQAPFLGAALNWGDIYSQLRKRIPNGNYLLGEEVSKLNLETLHIQTTSGNGYHPDFIIAADGVNSSIRRQMYPDVKPQYAGYIAWRGFITNADVIKQSIFNQHVPYFVYPHGHLLMYKIPSANGSASINWVLYEHTKNMSLCDILVDKNSVRHESSLPPGSLSDSKINYLHDFARANLPDFCADIISQTKSPFLQAISDSCVPSFYKQKICFVGDAAAVLRPHTASGVLKGVTDAIELFESVKSINNNQLDIVLRKWGSARKGQVQKQLELAKIMGNQLVIDPPDWSTIKSESIDEWWNNIMHHGSWYSTSKVAFFNSSNQSNYKDCTEGLNDTSQLNKP